MLTYSLQVVLLIFLVDSFRGNVVLVASISFKLFLCYGIVVVGARSLLARFPLRSSSFKLLFPRKCH